MTDHAIKKDPIPIISLIIPAYNEEAYLPALLESANRARMTFDAGTKAVELIVVDNASSDRTTEVAKTFGARVVREDRRIIAAVRNAGAKAARADILAFVDADSVVHPQIFNAIHKRYQRGGIIAGGSGVRLPRMSLPLILTYSVMLPYIWLTGMDTGVVFCRRDDFEAIGGYNESRLFAEDVEFLLALKRRGRRNEEKLCRLRQVKTEYSYRKFDQHGEWHYLRMLFRLLISVVFNPKGLNRFAMKYWYGDQRPPKTP